MVEAPIKRRSSRGRSLSSSIFSAVLCCILKISPEEIKCCMPEAIYTASVLPSVKILCGKNSPNSRFSIGVLMIFLSCYQKVGDFLQIPHRKKSSKSHHCYLQKTSEGGKKKCLDALLKKEKIALFYYHWAIIVIKIRPISIRNGAVQRIRNYQIRVIL